MGQQDSPQRTNHRRLKKHALLVAGNIVLRQIAPQVEEGNPVGAGPGNKAGYPDGSLRTQHGDQWKPYHGGPDMHDQRIGRGFNILAYEPPDTPDGDNVNCADDKDV